MLLLALFLPPSPLLVVPSSDESAALWHVVVVAVPT
jgi:hypothetical protein